MWNAGLCWLFLIIAVTEAAKKLDDYVRHYEELTYNNDYTHQQHLRARRSTSDPYVHIEFEAHGRHFNLRLRRDTTTLANDFKLVDHNDKEETFDRSILYEGHLWGEPNSLVFGSIIDGVFGGKIETPDETYHVERAFYHFDKPQNFHSIIYADSDVDTDPYRHKREAHNAGTCGSSHQDVQRFLKENSRAVEEEVPIVKRQVKEDRKAGENIYSEKVNRNKRATVPNAKTCTLYLQTDTELWNYFKSKLNNAPDTRVKEEIATLLAAHIKEVSSIYQSSDFQFTDSAGALFDYRGISFTVNRMKINTTASCSGDIGKTNPFCRDNIDVSNFLNLNSYQKHNDYCLAYVFTYRDFMKGTLGLAWVGSPGSQSGGICETYKSFKEGTATVDKSLNTGIVSILNYGKRVVPKVSYLTLAHEIGHNFGSNHDARADCIPFTTSSDPNGNYIMFASATSGDRTNNRKMSPCSLKNITAVIHSVMQGNNGKQNCFIAATDAFCGNGIVENDEECDCGYYGDCDDRCCIARETPNTALDEQCKRTTIAVCSPSQGPCCSDECQFIEEAANTTCQLASGCTAESKCKGGSPSCPAPAPEANGTACNDNTQTCFSGRCQGSICSRIGTDWEECFLVTDDFKQQQKDGTFDASSLCYVSCKTKVNGSRCWSSQQQDDSSFPAGFKTMLRSISSGAAIELPAGAPCDNFQGYCDVFSKCRKVDAEGPLARLKNLLFNPDTLESIKTWIVEKWWAVVLIIIGLILLMAGFIKLCAVHTPSSNPNKPAARKVSLHRPHVGGGRRQPQASGQSRGPPPDYYPGRGGPSPGHGHGRGGRRPEKVEMKQRRV